MLLNLKIRNYKSLREVKLDNLPAYSVMVGANASGKSNFVDALDFLSEVARSGLAAAVRAKGGYENICLRRARRSKAGIEFELTATIPLHFPRGRRGTGDWRFQYGFAFRATTERITADYEVTHERLAITQPGSVRPDIQITRVGSDAPVVDMSGTLEPAVLMAPREYIENLAERSGLPADELLWAARLKDLPPFWGLSQFLGACRVYQISPELARKPGIPERSPELGRHGENLPAAIDFLKRNEREAFDELVSHLRTAVSTMYNIETGYVETKELGLYFKEHGVGRRWYAQDVSDGTLKTVAMFLPLLDPRLRIVAIEEPENSLHPWILRHFMAVCQTHARTKQIFVTTQSPVAIDAVPVDSLFIVRRDKGETQIHRLDSLFPEAKRVVEEQLFGLGQYWDSGAIGAVPEADADVLSR